MDQPSVAGKSDERRSPPSPRSGKPVASGSQIDNYMDVRPGGIISIDIAMGDGQLSPNLGCILEVTWMS